VQRPLPVSADVRDDRNECKATLGGNLSLPRCALSQRHAASASNRRSTSTMGQPWL